MKSIRDLVAYYNTETERDTRYEVVEFLLGHLGQLDEMSMSDVARSTYVSKSTVSRLAGRFGFADYDELLEEARRYTRQDPTVALRITPSERDLVVQSPARFIDAYVDEVVTSLEQLKEALDIADVDGLIRQALGTQTAFFATDKPLTLARDLQMAFLAVGQLVLVGETKTKRMQIAHDLPEGSLAVVMSNYGRYVDGNQAMFEELRRRGVRLWLVTLCYSGPNTLLFDHVIRLSKEPYSNVGIYPMRAFVEILVRRLIAGGMTA